MWNRLRLTLIPLACGLLVAGTALQSLGQGTAGSRRPKAPAAPQNVKALDIQAEKLQSDFLKGLSDLAQEYESAGDMAKAKQMLEAILKVRPDFDAVKSKLKELEEAAFRNNDTILDVDASKNWTSTGVIVSKDKPVRIEAAGTYKFILNETVGPEGFPGGDITRDQIASLPNGALIGMVAPAPMSGNRNRRDRPEAFLVGSSVEFTPSSDGLLFLKFNVPPSAKCIGTVKVKISGHIQKVGG